MILQDASNTDIKDRRFITTKEINYIVLHDKKR